MEKTKVIAEYNVTTAELVKPAIKPDCIKYHYDVGQGSDEWLSMRRGILTASEMKYIVTPTLKIASNDKEKKHVYELAAQRITKYVEPHYYNDDMLRGHEDEIYAREIYSANYAPVTECGFITNDSFGFVIGYSPDGLVGDNGLIEIKSKKQYLQLRQILAGAVDIEHTLQLQTGLWVTQRDWIDHIIYCGGMKMFTLRVYPDPVVHNAITEASCAFEKRVQECVNGYALAASSGLQLIDTVRRVEQEITL